MTVATQLTAVVSEHGEGIGWHAAGQRVMCVDMLAGDLLCVDEDGAVERCHVDEVVAAWRPRAGGGLVVAVERGFQVLDADLAVVAEHQAWSAPGLRMNDGACDPAGRFYCGSMAYDARPGAGALWRLELDGSVRCVLDGLTIPNGLVWSRDGSEAFHIDTPTGRIDGYLLDPEAGVLRARRTVAVVTGGAPDGMTIDAEGGLWVALWGGSAVHRYDARGDLTAVVEVGAHQVTSCAFGGPALDRLFITTSRLGLATPDPAAGAVFVADVEVVGVPLLGFGG